MDELEKFKRDIPKRIKSGDLSPWQAVQVLAAKRSAIQANKVEGGEWTRPNIQANQTIGGSWTYPTAQANQTIGGSWTYPTAQANQTIGGSWTTPLTNGGSWQQNRVEGGTVEKGGRLSSAIGGMKSFEAVSSSPERPDRIEDGNWMDLEVERVEEYQYGNWMDLEVEQQSGNRPGSHSINPIKGRGAPTGSNRTQNRIENRTIEKRREIVQSNKDLYLSPEAQEAAYEVQYYRDELDVLVETGQIDSGKAQNIYRARLKELNVQEFGSGKNNDESAAELLEKIQALDDFYAETGFYDRALDDEPIWSPAKIMPKSKFFEPTFKGKGNSIGNPMGDLNPDPTNLGLISAQQIKLKKQNAERRAVEQRRQEASKKAKEKARADAERVKKEKAKQQKRTERARDQRRELYESPSNQNRTNNSSYAQPQRQPSPSSTPRSGFGGKNIGGTKALDAISNKKPGYGQDIRRIKDAYGVGETYRGIDYRKATRERDYRNSMPRGYRDYMEKTISQPPVKYRPTVPSRPKPMGVSTGNAAGQIVGDIHSTFANDYHDRIRQKAIELAGGLDKWNQLSPEQQRQLRLKAHDLVTPYLDTLRDAWRQGKPAFDRLWNKITGGRQNPMMPKGGLGRGLGPFRKGIDRIAPKAPHPFDNWDGSPWRGMTPDEIERDIVDRWEPWRKPGYYPGKEDDAPPGYDPRDPAWKPAGELPSGPKIRELDIGLWEIKAVQDGKTFDYSRRGVRTDVVSKYNGGLSNLFGQPGCLGIGVNGSPIIACFSSYPFTLIANFVPDTEIIPDAPPIPRPPKTSPPPAKKDKPSPKPKTPQKPWEPKEPASEPLPLPKPTPQPKPGPDPEQPKAPWAPPAPKPRSPTQPAPTPKPTPKPAPKPDPDPENPPAPLPKPKPKPDPKPDPTKPPPRPAIPKKPNRTTITIENPIPIPDPNDPPIPDDEDPDMPCRYMQDLEQAVSLNRYDPLTKTMQPSTYMVHQGMAEALQFLANEIADLKRSNHQINNVTEAQTLDTTGKVMVPQVQAEVVGTMMFAGAGVTTPVKTMSEQMQAWAALNHMLAGHHQLGKTEFPVDMMRPDGAKMKHTTALSFSHWMMNQITNMIGLPSKQVVKAENGTTTAQSFKNQSDAIENIHAQNLGMEQDLSAIEKYQFKILQALEIITNIVFQNKHDIDVIIDELGPKTKQKIVSKPSPVTHGKNDAGESFFDRLMSMANNFTVVREWNDEIDAKQLAQKTNMEAQIAALTNKWEFDKTNPKLPIVDRPKNQSPKQQNDDEWRRYVNTSENPDQMRQAPGLPIPEIKEIKLGITKEVPKPEINPEKLLGS